MVTLLRYEVSPVIPAPLSPLLAIGQNLWWSWHESARALFSQIDPELYKRVAENPRAVLAEVPQKRLNELARDPAFLEAIARVKAELDHYLHRETWFDRTF